MLFIIESNGYLYQLAKENQFGAYWPAVQSNSNGKGGINGYPDLGYPANSNLKCTYDENYLLSCVTVLASGILSPVNFAYQQDGSYYQWMAVSKPDVLPTLYLYVEVVAPYPTTTASSSPSVIPTCTLTPRLPNRDFEDGTNKPPGQAPAINTFLGLLQLQIPMTAS
jgi:hypothetical protein